MEPILWEVLNCVFVGFAANEERLRDKEGTLKALYSMPTYFDKHREQLELYEDVSTKLALPRVGARCKVVLNAA
jgi:hypothetical protein